MTWVGGIVLLTLAVPAWGQSPQKPDELFATARPHLEAVLGGRLQRLPAFRTVTPAELAALPDGLIDLQVPWQLADLDAAAQGRARSAATAALRGAMVAGLAEGSDTIYFAPDNAGRIAHWDPSLAAADSQSFLRLALVHETTRWILDQQYDLAKRRAACRDSEELIALQSLVEGRCQWVARQVARRLGDEATFALFAEAYRQAPDTAGEGTVRVLCRDVLDRRRWCCIQGLAFFDHLETAGLKEGAATAFSRPPRQIAWIERPELYVRSQRLNLGDLADLLKPLEEALPPADWQAMQQPWTPEMLTEVAASLGEGRRAESVARGWDAGRTLVWSNRSNLGQQVGLGVLRFQDATAARAYLGLAADLQRKQDEMLNAACANRRCMQESHAEALHLNGADEAMRVQKKVGLGDKGESMSITQVWARAGERVVEFTWYGVPGDADWAQRVLDVLLKEK
jgi:hypothetical protein